MSKIRILILAVVVCLICTLTGACGKNNNSNASEETQPESEENRSEQEESKEEESEAPEQKEDDSSEEEQADADSEKAMNNFLAKLEAGNYVIDVKDYRKITAYSPEQVRFEFYTDPTLDYAFFTLENETFQGYLEENGIADVSYYSGENALEAAKSQLPNSWVDLGDGNIYNLFYNDVENPLQFVSYDDTIKMSLLLLGGYQNAAMNKMHEVFMTLDAEDPSEVRFTAAIDDDEVARIYYDDLDLTIRFGAGDSDARIEDWLKAPVYPETRTAWNDDDLFYLNSVYLPGYGKDALPFPDFASYALKFDDETFSQTESILLTDGHASEEDVENYKKTLLDNGFSEVTAGEEGSEETVYRKVLREEYRCYINARPYYDNGFVLEAGKYYDSPSYEGLSDINKVLEEYGFAALQENEHITEWQAADHAAERTESWLYYYDYDLSLFVSGNCDDSEAMENYLKEYQQRLEEKGFHANYINAGEDEPVLESCSSADDLSMYKYTFGEDGETFTMEFRVQKGYSLEEASKAIKEAGFPEITLQGNASCRNITKYHYYTRGFEGTFLFIYQPFEKTEDAEAFLDAYAAALEDDGFYKTSPENVGSMRQNVYYNEDKDIYVGFDFIPEENVTNVNFEFVNGH